MRVYRALVFLAISCSPSLAADLTIRVVDPHSAAVPGAQVSVFLQGSSAPTFVTTTSAEGLASVAGLKDGSYRLQIFAPGFAAQTSDLSLPQSEAITIKLNLASVSETVVVSATRSPLPVQDALVSISTLESD